MATAINGYREIMDVTVVAAPEVLRFADYSGTNEYVVSIPKVVPQPNVVSSSNQGVCSG